MPPKNEAWRVKFVISFVLALSVIFTQSSENTRISASQGPTDEVKSSQVNPKVDLGKVWSI